MKKNNTLNIHKTYNFIKKVIVKKIFIKILNQKSLRSLTVKVKTKIVMIH